MRSKYTLYIFFSLLLLLSCSKTEKTYTIETKDGVNYVQNHAPLWGDEPKVALEFVQKIGVMEGEDENYMLYKPRDVARDIEGNIYIIDSGNYRVQKFNAEGEFLASFGRQGQGPGEVGLINSINIVNDAELYISDPTNMRMVMFDIDGNFIKTLRMDFNNMFYDFRILKSGKIVVRPVSIFMPDEPTDVYFMNILDNECKFISGFGAVKNYYNDDVNFKMHLVRFVLDRDDNVNLTFVRQNRIEKYAPDGTILLCADRPLNYSVNKSPKSEDEVTSVSNFIAVDYKNRFWVETFTRQRKKQQKEESKKPGPDIFVLEIFDQDYILLGKLDMPEYGFIRIFEDHLYIIDSNYEMCVYEYKIVEK